MDAANILKPLLARGELRVIGATTLAEYRKIERDSALARRFSPVTVEEPSVDDTVEILRGLRGAYETHHGVFIDDAALAAAARLSDRYISEYHLPDKAIDLIDQAAAKLRLAGGANLRPELEKAIAAEDYETRRRLKKQIDAATVRSRSARPRSPRSSPRAPASRWASWWPASCERLNELEDDLHQRVVGQDERRRGRRGHDPPRPRRASPRATARWARFLFLGPTGVGKTELVKALSERLFATEKALVRIDMSEFREPHTVARLIGSPPGYVGYGEGGQLTEPVRRRPYSVILLDEIEKAHPEVWNVLLQVMDDGRLTDGEGRTVDFTNAVIVMTSNLGAGKAKRGIGFTAGEPAAEAARMEDAAKQAFLPEFINRIDEIVTFDVADPEQRRADRGPDGRAASATACSPSATIALSVDEELIAKLAREGFDEAYGARPLQRHIRRTLEKALTKAILAGEINDGDHVYANADGSLTVDVHEHALAA